MHINKYSARFIQFSDRLLPPTLINLFRHHPPGKILDLGCGDGVVINHLTTYHKIKPSCISGTDISQLRLDRAKQLNPHVKFIYGNGQLLPFKDRSFDLIYSLMVIEHVQNQHQFIREAWRALGQNGRLFLSSVIKLPGAWYFYKNSLGERVLDPTHVREYASPQILIKLLKHHGFSSINYTVHPMTYQLGELLFRPLIITGLISPNFAKKILSSRSLLIRLIKSISINIPNYQQIDIYGQK